jgi:hypothetical protein
MEMSRIKNRITESLTEACGYSPLTKVVSEEEINRILEQESGWIPVSERLPEESLNSVIGWDTYRNRCCFVQYLGGRFVLGYDIDGVNVTAWMPLPESYSTDAEKPHIEKPQTNADRIRSMTDEELAEFLPIASNFICQPTEECIRNTVMNHCGECERTEECAMKWLRAESEG